jgi:hypothetical protein
MLLLAPAPRAGDRGGNPGLSTPPSITFGTTSPKRTITASSKTSSLSVLESAQPKWLKSDKVFGKPKNKMKKELKNSNFFNTRRDPTS